MLFFVSKTATALSFKPKSFKNKNHEVFKSRFVPKLDSRFGQKHDSCFGQEIVWGPVWSPAHHRGRALLVCHTVICIFSVVTNRYKKLLRGFEMIYTEKKQFYKNFRPPSGKAYKVSDLGERAPKGRASPSR